MAITRVEDTETQPLVSAASILFPAGFRPSSEDLQALARQDRQFSVSLDPMEAAAAQQPGRGAWVELVINGLTFDLGGLAPGEGGSLPDRRHSFGLPDGFEPAGLEAITLEPGPHLAGGRMMLPVLRSLALLAARLAALPGAVAVAWHGAGTWNSIDHFRSHVMRWIEGGAFPALGLAALKPTAGGGIETEGLALFTGQELHISPSVANDRAGAARIALRLVHWLVENGPLPSRETLTGPGGEHLQLEPDANRRMIKVWIS